MKSHANQCFRGRRINPSIRLTMYKLIGMTNIEQKDTIMTMP